MRILVCGSHRFGERSAVWAQLDRLHAKRPVSLVIQGGAEFVDRFAKEWAEARGIPCDEYKAYWKIHGKTAGPIRNRAMLVSGRPDGVVAFPGENGTANMIQQARRAGIKVWQPKV